MDQLLLPYLHASDDSEKEHYLEELLLFHTAAVVIRALRRNLGFMSINVE
jgi:hypothetical protein